MLTDPIRLPHRKEKRMIYTSNLFWIDDFHSNKSNFYLFHLITIETKIEILKNSLLSKFEFIF